MKKVFFIVAALVFSSAMMAQATPQEKREVKNDLARERDKRHEVARDILNGEPAKARADNRAAIAYHKEAHRDMNHIQQIHHRRMHPHHRVVVVHHRRYYRHHPRRTVVVIHH